jgi:hypothetical protein
VTNSQTILWTALPNGVTSAGDGRLSVFVAPRLLTDDPTTTMDAFPDFVDWPARVREASFAVTIDGVAGPIATQPDPAAWTPSSPHWTALFKPTSPVRAFRFVDRSDYKLVSYSVGSLLDQILDEYHRLGLRYPDDLPTYEQVSDPELGLRVPSLLAAAGDRALSALLSDPDAIDDRRARELARVLRFHQPGHTELVEPTTPNLEFHDVIAALGQFPVLLRDLGLVIDLLLPGIGELPPGGIRVHPAWSPVTPTTSVTPITRWQVPFAAAPRPANPDLSDGLLLLGSGQFRAFQVDIDGAAFKLAHMADTLHRYTSSPVKSAPPTTGLPALRSAGIAVARSGRAQQIQSMLNQARRHNDIASGAAPGDIELFAEDLVRGYHPVVLPAFSAQWLPLCRRRETHRFLDVTDINDSHVSQEADSWVSSAGTESSGPTPDLHLHEVIFRWDGWSLAVPRPSAGLALDPDAHVEKPTREPTIPPADFRLETSLAIVPGTLPRLRFGQRYQIGAFAVDLAGHSTIGFRLGDPAVTIETTYLRYEPAMPPVVVLTAPLSPVASPGEALDRLVIRTNNSGTDGNAAPASGLSERHLAAPMGSQQLAEMHGVFDGQDPQASYALITAREGVFPEAGGSSTDPLVPVAELQPNSSLALPYLPDPIATGVTLTDVPGLAPGDLGEIRDDGPLAVVRPEPPHEPPMPVLIVETVNKVAWQSPRSFRIRLADGDGPPIWDAASRVLTLQVPRGSVRTLRLSSMIERYLDQMALWREKQATAGASELERFNVAASQGRQWSLSPAATLTLVHATRQPTQAPFCKKLQTTRAVGATDAVLDGTVEIDRSSTGDIAIEAESEEWLDTGNTPEEPTTRPMHVGTLRIAPIPMTNATKRTLIVDLAAPPDGAQPVRHELGDTRYRRVHYRAVGLTRFAEYFPERTDQLTRASDPVTVDVPASARPDVPRIRAIVPTFSWSREIAGGVPQSVRSGNGLRIYLERPWYSSGGGELLGVIVMPRASQQNPDPLATVGQYVTRYGSDPLTFTYMTTSGQLTSFRRAIQRVEDVALAELNGDTTIHVAAHEVRFDRARECWYADIVIRDPQIDFFQPFVRLALARYQPNGLQDAGVDLRLSPIVLAEPVQLLPDRVVSFSPDPVQPGRWFVQVNGQTYRARAAEDGTTLNGGHAIEVSIEQRRPEIADDVLGWEPEPAAVVEAEPVVPQYPPPIDPGPVIWKGRVTVPSGGEMRLVVREYEELAADGPKNVTTVRRLVYADTIALE